MLLRISPLSNPSGTIRNPLLFLTQWSSGCRKSDEEGPCFAFHSLMAVAPAEKVAAFALLILLLRLPPVAPDSAGGDPGSDGAALSTLVRQEAQLARLESLVETLSAAVSHLESTLYNCSRPPGVATRRRLHAGYATVPPPSGGVAVIKQKPSWYEHFQFAAAARLDAEATAAVVFPYAGHDGTAKYFAVGDALGRTFVLSSVGDILVELPPPPLSSLHAAATPVTAMLAYPLPRRNESLLLVGHSDGSVVAHRLWESAASGDDWFTLSLAGSRPFVGGERESPAILGLEFHKVGRLRYVVASDGSGRIRVFMENGTLYGTAAASSRPLAFVKQRLLFLTETGAGSLDLRTMAVRETECEGFNGTHRAKTYAFDISERSKAYGFTSGGHLIHVVLLGDGAGVKCRLRAMRKSEIDAAISVLAVKGYLLAVSQEKIVVYNVSSHYYGRAGAPRPLFHATLEEIKLQFLDPRSTANDGALQFVTPLIAGDREKLLIVGLGDGYVGVYRSNLPVYRAETNAVLWSSPVLVFLLLLIGIWHFYVKKRDVLGLTQDEVFNTSMAGSTGRIGSVVGGDRERDRNIGDGSIGYDLRDIRGGTLRRPPRRYVSPPSHYAGGPAAPLRAGATDSAFSGGGDLKYRRQRLKPPPGFPKRREAISTGSQVIVDEHAG